MGLRVALDARRQRDNGIARVTRLLAIAMSRLPVELVLLGPPAAVRKQFPHAEIVQYDVPLISDEDLLNLDVLLKSLAVDCFVAPQFYNSPWTSCPQIRVLHDVFPLERGAKLTSLADVESSFGVERVTRVREALLGEAGLSSEDVPRLLYRAYYDAATRNASTVLTVSTQSRAGLLTHYPDIAGKLEVLPLFADPALAALPGPGSGPALHALHVSKFEPRKNQLTLLLAWEQLWKRDEDFRACIVGSPSFLYPAYTEQLLERIQVHERDGWLTHMVGIEDTGLAELYQAAAVVCMSSIAEGFGLPALEAMANGCAVVALPGTAVDEVCGPHVIHAENSAKSIADAIAEVLANPPEKASSSNPYRRHASTFTVEQTSSVLGTAIERAVGYPLTQSPLQNSSEHSRDQFASSLQS